MVKPTAETCFTTFEMHSRTNIQNACDRYYLLFMDLDFFNSSSVYENTTAH